MIAGIRNSRAEKHTFRHNDVHCAACKNAPSRRGGGAMNSGPTGSVISLFQDALDLGLRGGIKRPTEHLIDGL
jgi:hypothetical protein